LKMSGDAAPWTRAPTTKLRGLPQTPRVRDLVNVGFGARMKQNPNMSTLELKQGLWANPSQSIARKPWSVVPATTTTSCELYSYEADAVLSGLAMMRCMGHPSDSCPIECFSERDLRSRAGESFSVPIIAVLTYAFYLSPFAPWCTSSAPCGAESRSRRRPYCHTWMLYFVMTMICTARFS
jgi:hypothetical protein